MKGGSFEPNEPPLDPPLPRRKYFFVLQPHTSVFNFEFCLYGTYVVAGVIDTAGHSYCLLLLSPCEPIVLLHS